MMSKDGKFVLVFVLISLLILDIVCVCGSIKVKEEYVQYYPISDVTSELVDQDLKAGLRSLSSAELKTLSEYIDEESGTTKSNAFEDVADDYNICDSLSGDLNVELANENVELNTGSVIRNNPLQLSKNRNNMDKDDTIRTKRNSPEDSETDDVNVQEYFKDLENSFPQNHREYFNATDEAEKEHIRVKRL